MTKRSAGSRKESSGKKTMQKKSQVYLRLEGLQESQTHTCELEAPGGASTCGSLCVVGVWKGHSESGAKVTAGV